MFAVRQTAVLTTTLLGHIRDGGNRTHEVDHETTVLGHSTHITNLELYIFQKATNRTRTCIFIRYDVQYRRLARYCGISCLSFLSLQVSSLASQRALAAFPGLVSNFPLVGRFFSLQTSYGIFRKRPILKQARVSRPSWACSRHPPTLCADDRDWTYNI